MTNLNTTYNHRKLAETYVAYHWSTEDNGEAAFTEEMVKQSGCSETYGWIIWSELRDRQDSEIITEIDGGADEYTQDQQEIAAVQKILEMLI